MTLLFVLGVLVEDLIVLLGRESCSLLVQNVLNLVGKPQNWSSAFRMRCFGWMRIIKIVRKNTEPNKIR